MSQRFLSLCTHTGFQRLCTIRLNISNLCYKESTDYCLQLMNATDNLLLVSSSRLKLKLGMQAFNVPAAKLALTQMTGKTTS